MWQRHVSVSPGSAEAAGQGEEEQRGRTKTWEQKQKQIQEHSPLWVFIFFCLITLKRSDWDHLNQTSFPSLSQVDDTRVVLRNADPCVVGSDYINGNYVKVRVQTLCAHSNTTWRQHKKTHNRKLTHLVDIRYVTLRLLCVLIHFVVCRTTCGSQEIRRFTSPVRAA